LAVVLPSVVAAAAAAAAAVLADTGLGCLLLTSAVYTDTVSLKPLTFDTIHKHARKKKSLDAT
jgi:hypothetical protein